MTNYDLLLELFEDIEAQIQIQIYDKDHHGVPPEYECAYFGRRLIGIPKTYMTQRELE